MPHVGPANYGSANIATRREQEFRQAFETVVSTAVTRNVNAVVVTGQLFATQSLSEKNIDAFNQLIDTLEANGIALLLTGSSRDRDHELIEELKETKPVTILSDTPVVVGDIAIYGASDSKPTTVRDQVNSFDSLPSAAESAVLAVQATLSPPVTDGQTSVTNLLSESPVSFDSVLAGHRLHTQHNFHQTIEDTQIYQTAHVEYLFRKRVLEDIISSSHIYPSAPTYPCSISVLEPTRTVQKSVPHRPFAMYRIQNASSSDLEQLNNMLETEDRTVLVHLLTSTASDALSKAELSDWLADHAAVHKVWSERSTDVLTQSLTVDVISSSPPVTVPNDEPPSTSTVETSSDTENDGASSVDDSEESKNQTETTSDESVERIYIGGSDELNGMVSLKSSVLNDTVIPILRDNGFNQSKEYAGESVHIQLFNKVPIETGNVPKKVFDEKLNDIISNNKISE